jgi:hypothetical protein
MQFRCVTNAILAAVTNAIPLRDQCNSRRVTNAIPLR